MAKKGSKRTVKLTAEAHNELVRNTVRLHRLAAHLDLLVMSWRGRGAGPFLGAFETGKPADDDLAVIRALSYRSCAAQLDIALARVGKRDATTWDDSHVMARVAGIPLPAKRT